MIDKELLDLLYYIKELAANKTPISLNSLINTIESTQKYTYYLDRGRTYPRIEILSKARNEHGCLNHICTLGFGFINNIEILIHSCRYTRIDDLEYGINDNGELFYFEYS